nr:hypothetical protein [Allomuricauda sp.]
MKSLYYFFFACVFIWSCKEKSADQKAEGETAQPEAQQWISYKGDANQPHIVLVSGDEEYRSEEALPQMAKILTERHGFNCTVLFAQDPKKPGILNPNNVNNIPGLEQLETADLMILFTRFRALPDNQMQHIDNYLKAGKPVIGIRTATHAFNFEDGGIESSYKHYGNFYEGDDAWKDGFGRLVLGEKWISHHGVHRHQSTKGIPAPGAQNHSLLNGIKAGDIWGPSDVYGVRLPLPGDAQPIVLGQVIDREAAYDENDNLYGMRISDDKLATTNLIEIEEEEDEEEEMEEEEEEDEEEVEEEDEDWEEEDEEYNPNDPLMPIAWTKSYQLPGGKQGKAFATTIGASTDLVAEGTRRMFINATYWCLDLEVPQKANVDLIGEYNPTPFAFLEDEHWENLNKSISSIK